MRYSIKNRIKGLIFFIMAAQILFVFVYFYVLRKQLAESWYTDKSVLAKILTDRLKEDINSLEINISSLLSKYRSFGIELKEAIWRITGDIEHITACGYYDMGGHLMFYQERAVGSELLPKTLKNINWKNEVIDYHSSGEEAYLNLKIFDKNNNVPMGFMVCTLNLKSLLKDYIRAYGIRDTTITLVSSEGIPVLTLNRYPAEEQLRVKNTIKNMNMSMELSEPISYVYKKAYDFLKAALILSITLCTALLLLGFFMVNRIFKPLEELKIYVSGWASGKKLKLNGQGEVFTLASAFKDLLERLDKERSIYINLFNNLNDALVLVDNEQGNIQMTNKQFLNMFRIAEKDAVGLNIKELSDSLKTGLFSFIPEININLKGQSRYVSVTSIPLEIDERGYTLFHIKDVTDKKNLEFLLERYSKLAIVGEIACSLAHQLNNPLASVIGYTEYIRNTIDNGEIKDMMNVVLKNAERARDTIKRLLHISTNHNGSPTEIEPLKFTKDLLDIMNFKAKQKNLVMELFSQTKGGTISTYAWELEQVLINIIDNAIDASPDGGKVHVEILEEDSFIVWKVRDEGHGVKSDKVFEPFYTEKNNGFGLGLSIARRFVENMGGSIDYENLSTGCEFRVYIRKRGVK
ncbi:MAG: ATP-binding protein [Aquificaceae bacterium]|jgi:two-component system NtrC family sensor kinase|uniref:two-component system sensor histidine kinase NtrB n=1 Tax=Hydrogenobacter sp. Uz 6-8 TaxID=3384828 RepID=UPI0030B77AFB